uniref:Sortilin 1b n=1 Tax=Astyanax mexicanus TaxID=7994 RepID=A0A8B9JUU1_ASTMX
MLRLRHFISVVLLPIAALSLDFNQFSGGPSRNARSLYEKTPLSERSRIIKQAEHSIHKRSADSGGDTCNSLQRYDTKLTSNTHSVSYNNLVIVLLALTTFQVPLFMLRFGQSRLYRSEDYGKTFQDVTELISNTFISTDFGIAIGPESSGKVILTGDLSGSGSARIFLSSDFGNSFTRSDLPFNPKMQIMYNPQNPNVLVAISTKPKLLTVIHLMKVLAKLGLSQYLFVFVWMIYFPRMPNYPTTSPLFVDGSVQTVVSFDQGGEWVPLRKPENSECDSTAKDKDKCSLHIHASYSISMKLNVPMLPLSEPNAVGLIIAHGNVLKLTETHTQFLSLSLSLSLSLLFSLTHSPTLTKRHSDCLKSCHILCRVGRVSWVERIGSGWIFFTSTDQVLKQSLNLSILFVCSGVENDYVPWLAHSDDISDPKDGCMLGYKEKFLRLKKDSVCWNGRDYNVNKQPTPCACTLDDFLCDFGYYRNENSSDCLEQPELKGHDLELCIHGKKEHLQTNGYRKIPGDKCEGGNQPERKEVDIRKKCISNLLDPQKQNNGKPSHSAPIIVTVIAIVLVSCIAGALFVKKYVCGGRFLVHRYSVLQHNAEANGIEGMDETLDTNVAGHAKIGFHDDSDEDLLE